MSDVTDFASEREEAARAAALEEQTRRAGLAGQSPCDSATHCRTCGDPIPPARRRVLPGVQTCVDCQSYRERVSRRV